METVILSGAGGFVGNYLLPLLAADYNVVACFRTTKPQSIVNNLRCNYEIIDFQDREAVHNLFGKYKPGLVVHAGAMSRPDDCETQKEQAYNTNVTGTLNMLEAAAQYSCFFLFMSTDFVFDGVKGLYKEYDPTGEPVNYYGKTKLLAEEAVKKYNNAWAIVRTVLVYGKPLPGRHNILTVVKEKLENGEGYNVFDDQVRTPTYVEDLVWAIKSIIDLRKEGLFHISGEDIVTPYDMAVEVAKFIGADETLLKKTDQNNFIQPALRPLKTGFDITKAIRELNYKPTSFLEGIRKTFS